jgi:hypothetical protein
MELCSYFRWVPSENDVWQGRLKKKKILHKILNKNSFSGVHQAGSPCSRTDCDSIKPALVFKDTRKSLIN